MSTFTRKRVALVGLGHRGTGMWGRELLDAQGRWVEMVGLCDSNARRREHAQSVIGADVPVHADYTRMLREVRPDCVIVCVPDHLHDTFIVEALEAGCDVITEKPMAISAARCARIIEAEQRTGRRVDVAFNYRFTPTSVQLKQLLASGVIGPVQSVDFSWFLDVQHGADYFRRWHARQDRSGSLFVHKASHHFDLLNWWLDDEPVQVFARAALRRYGRNGVQGGTRCRTCERRCEFHTDIGADPWLAGLYEQASQLDGYVRDACVFRPEIDIPDTMSASLSYRSGTQVNYSLNTYLPIEGYQLAFNGLEGRIEVRQHERQPWAAPPADEIRVLRNAGPARTLWVAHGAGGHFGGDAALQDRLFRPAPTDPLGQRAGARAGALAALCGIAAMKSVASGQAEAVEAVVQHAP
ncbi:oxidoreductase family protein [Sphaerotilus hippei]|uniref:Oxidoreductase family protein n=1 Tax=Sphaerotilus hippei TaxID=744406 RepID=A0A318H3F2_9BURK|nr:Gfo/Idh/MocA family oxidoreductase [Sphaerotilus hippei]PXW97494.1 oxidoreductase family protein [Sphaerotilus hippei]